LKPRTESFRCRGQRGHLSKRHVCIWRPVVGEGRHSNTSTPSRDTSTRLSDRWKTQHCDTLPEKQKDNHEKRSMVRRRPGQPPYIDVIDVASHAPLRPWKTPVSSDEALRHCRPSAWCLSDIGTRCQAEHCADESVGRLLQQTPSATAQNRGASPPTTIRSDKP
jgi:hypothetical protein